MGLNSKYGSVSKRISYISAPFDNYCITDGNDSDLLVLEFLALVLCVTVLILITGKFEPLVIVSSTYPKLGLTVTGHLKRHIHSSVLELN